MTLGIDSPLAKPCGGGRSEDRQREKAVGIRQSHGAAVQRSQIGYRSAVRTPEPGFADGEAIAGVIAGVIRAFVVANGVSSDRLCGVSARRHSRRKHPKP